MTTTATPGRELLELAEYHEAECNRYHVSDTGCTTLRCLKRGGWHIGLRRDDCEPTCEAHETASILRRLAAKPADEGELLVTASSLTVAWNSYVGLFGGPPYGTEKQMRALLQLAPSTTGEPKRSPSEDREVAHEDCLNCQCKPEERCKP
jgi:hypothetical protein